MRKQVEVLEAASGRVYVAFVARIYMLTGGMTAAHIVHLVCWYRTCAAYPSARSLIDIEARPVRASRPGRGEA